MTTIAGAAAFPTLSNVPSWLSTVDATLVDAANDSPTLVDLKQKMARIFDARFGALFATASTALCAAFLDPRFSGLPFSRCTDSVRQAVRERVENELVALYIGNSAIVNATVDEKDRVLAKLQPATLKSFVAMYMEIISGFNSAENFEVLHCAKSLLCIPATSIPAQRAFSSAGFIFSARRQSMTDQTEDSDFLRESCDDADLLLAFAETYAPEKWKLLQDL